MLLMLAGCQTLASKWDLLSRNQTPSVPDRMLPIWTDTVLHQPAQPAVRGFGGRLYFYRDQKDNPIKVEGSLTVYVFDGDKASSTQAVPLKKFVITPEQLASHHSTTSLGDSYSVWIPWDLVGGPNRTLSLVARFDGRNGGTVLSEPATKLLPGVWEIDRDASQIQKVSATVDIETADIETADDEPRQPSMATLSIDLSPSFQRRLMGESQQSEVSRPDESSSQPSRSTTAIADRLPVRRKVVELRDSVADPTALGTVRSSPQRFPARREPRVQPGRAPLRRLPHLSGWPSALPPTPRSGIVQKNGAIATTLSSNGYPRRRAAVVELKTQAAELGDTSLPSQRVVTAD